MFGAVTSIDLAMRGEKLAALFLAVLVGLLPVCNGEQKNSPVAAYQCSSDYAKITTPPAISPTKRIIRVCITTGTSSSECKKVVEATMSHKMPQVSKKIEEILVVAGQVPLAAFAGVAEIEIRSKGKTCMLAAQLTEKYFTEMTSASSLQVGISGAVSVALASTSNTTACLQKVPFKVAVRLAHSAVPKSTAKPTTMPTSTGKQVGTAIGSVKSYQCTPDAITVHPHTISKVGRMFRVCIGGDSNAVKCQKVTEATISQRSSSIKDRLVEKGEELEATKKFLEIEYNEQAGKCMITAYISDKYFIQTSGTVVMSGTVDVIIMTTGEVVTAGGQFSGLIAQQSGVKFDLAVNLTQWDDFDDQDPRHVRDSVNVKAFMSVLVVGLVSVLALELVFALELLSV